MQTLALALTGLHLTKADGFADQRILFIGMRLFLDRIIDEEHPIILLDRAHQRLNVLPQRFPV